MKLSEFENRRVQRLFKNYCNERIPLILQGKLKLEFRIHDSEVVLFESRVHYRQVDVWYTTSVARFLKDSENNVWRLFSADRNDDWVAYLPHPYDRNLEQLMDVVNEDVTGIFWG